jgi:Ca-activated chloride channel family protein
MSNEQNIPPRDELDDQLVDRHLRELIGGETPPDLSQRILQAAGGLAPAALVPAGGPTMNAADSPRRSWAPSWLTLAVAVCLLIGMGMLIMPAGKRAREAAKKAVAVAQADESKSKDEADRLSAATDEVRSLSAVVDAEVVADDTLSDLAEVREEALERARDAAPAVASMPASAPAGPESFEYTTAPVPTTEGMPVAGEPVGETTRRYAIPADGVESGFGGNRGGYGGGRGGYGGGGERGGYGGRRGGDGGIIVGRGDSSGNGNQGGERGVAYGEAEGGQEGAGEGESGAPAAGADALGTLALGEEAPLSDSGASVDAPAAPADRSHFYSEQLVEAPAAPLGKSPYSGSAIADYDDNLDLILGTVSGAENGTADQVSSGSGLIAQASPQEIMRARALSDLYSAEAPFVGVPLRRLDSLGRPLAELSEGRGPDAGGDQYAPIVENPFRAINAATTDNRLSTFSIDVDTAAYANVRQFLMQGGTLPPPDAVRIEELVNYFDYDYTPPADDVPFAANVEVAGCPWTPEHRLVRIGIKGREMDNARRPKSNLVFLVDVSGSMDEPAKLPLLVEGMKLLTRELGENDRVAIVVYASSEGLALDSTRGDQQQTILDALGRLSAGGSTAGGAGITLAYSVAEQNFIKGGVNRIILCTDGDFNVGVTSPAELQRLAEDKAKATGVFLTVIGFGRGNLNDAMMEQVADHGNGNYHYVDNLTEARKVLVEEMTGTLVTIAKDVKIQIEFNPLKVAGYRLIGYENRVLAAEDFNDDKKDAGEIGAGHTVTALYEIVPAGQNVDATVVDELRYARPTPPAAAATPADGEVAAAAGGAADDAAASADAASESEVEESTPMSDELLTLKIRYKQPDGDESTKLEFPITDGGQNFSSASGDFQFASAVASFGMLLRGSQFRGDATLAGVLEIAESAKGEDQLGYRTEFVDMIRRARELSGQ